MQLTHIRLLVNDFTACYRFYRDVMEFKPAFGEENDVYADFDTGSVALALFARSAMSEAVGTTNLPVNPPGQDHVAIIFQVENVDEAYRQLREKGVTFVTPPTDRPDWGERAAHLRDPDGNLIELYHFIPMESLGMMRFAYIWLPVDNFAACFHFYQEVIGLKVKHGSADDVYAEFDTGGTPPALVWRDGMHEATGLPDTHTSNAPMNQTVTIFAVDNVDDSYRQLAATGVELIAPPTNQPKWGSRVAFFRDPAGNLIEIFQPLSLP